MTQASVKITAPDTGGKKQKRKKKKKKYTWKFKLFVGLQIFFLVIVLAAIGLYYGSGYGFRVHELHKDAVEKVRASSEETFRSSQTSVVYDANGNLISTLKGEKDVYYLDYNEIPVYVKTTFVSIEDKKFFKHAGIDIKAIARAALSYVKNKRVTQGGSTITQQLARNVFLSHEVTWERKAEEVFISLELEKIYSKTKLLEFYINNIYFANGYYGIQAASKGYFNKEVTELDLSQIAFLCAIPNNPTLYNPVEHMDNTIKRRNRILRNMLEDAVIDQETHDSAVTQEITLDIAVSEKANYVETFVYYCATRALMQQNGFKFQYSFNSDSERKIYEADYSEVYNACQKTLYTGGYQIYTSIDMSVQEKLQNSVDERLKSFTSKSKDGIYELQASATCIDNSNGYVRAIVGGRSQTFVGYTLNRSYQSFRQPGSSIKPLIVYTPILERNYTPDSTVTDSKIEDGPSNSDNYYEGDITLRRAVAKSRNTVAWNLFQELTPKVGLSYITNMEFSKIVDDDYHLASALGGFTKGASSLEMAGGFAAIANDGMFRTPTCIIRILDADSTEIYHSNRDGTRVYKQNAARMITDVLQTAIKEGTGKGLAITNMSSAGKTGTTNDNKDGWFCGFSPYYTTSVWVGYDMPKKLPGLYGSSYPGDIWHQFMETLHSNLQSKDFPSASHSSNKKSTATPDPTTEPTENPQTIETEHPVIEETQPPDIDKPSTPEPTKAPEVTEQPIATLEPTKKPEPTRMPDVTRQPVVTKEPDKIEELSD